MKFTQKLASLVTGAAITVCAVIGVKAQTLDAFNQLRALPVANIIIPTNGVAASTNGPFDMIGYVNRGILAGILSTNGGAGAASVTLQLQTSTDTTNWSAVSNYALITQSTAVIYTNLGVLSAGQIWSSTNFSFTDNYLLPYTLATPYAPIAGFAPPYSAPNVFTNQSATVNIPGNQWFELSANWTDQQRYMRAIWTYSGAVTNAAFNNYINAIWFGPRIYAP